MPEPGTAGFVQSCGTGAAILRPLLYKILEDLAFLGLYAVECHLLEGLGIGVHSPKKQSKATCSGCVACGFGEGADRAGWSAAHREVLSWGVSAREVCQRCCC